MVANLPLLSYELALHLQQEAMCVESSRGRWFSDHQLALTMQKQLLQHEHEQFK